MIINLIGLHFTAGIRGLEIEGKAGSSSSQRSIDVYLEESAVKSLAAKWTGKIADELSVAPHFYEDIINGPFDKFVRVTMVVPLTGEQYSDNVAKNCVNHWKETDIYTDAEAEAVVQFKEVFKSRNFPPGESLLLAFSASGAISIAFSEGESVLKQCDTVIKNKVLCMAVFDSIIGKHGVSPVAKCNLAVRLAQLLNQSLS